MLAVKTVKSMDVRENFKALCDRVFHGETLIVSRPKNENVVIMSETEYNEIMKAKRNADYLAMLDKSMAEAEAGGFIIKVSMNWEHMKNECSLYSNCLAAIHRLAARR